MTDIKPLCLIRAPLATRSGYGDAARDIARHIIESDKYDVKIHSVPWGDTPMNALDSNNPKDKMILDRLLYESLTKQPELFISITVPNEFQPIGKYNIGITAGVETTLAAPEWLQGCNRMDTVWFMSEFGRQVFQTTGYHQQKSNKEIVGELKVTKPMEVLHNCIDTKIFKKLDYEHELESSIKETFGSIKESFNFLFVGHWLRGDLGEDRKNVGLLVKIFLETFRQVKTNQPGLILKTSGAGFSILDQEEILKKIDLIRNTVKLDDGQTMPNIYLVHGELTDKEMNSMYNHPKVKAHVSLTKGEGFGRPLLEASMSAKPLIVSGWSGHLDFLSVEDSAFVGGELKQLHPSSVWEGVLLKEASWFSPDINQAANAMYGVFIDYGSFKKRAGPLAKKNKSRFNYETIKQETIALLDKYVPNTPVTVELKLPMLKKVELPELKKVE